MRHAAKYFALSCALVFLLPIHSYAQAKIKVAIWEFDNNAPHSYWFWDQMGPAARNTIDTQFSENKLLSSKFTRDRARQAQPWC